MDRTAVERQETGETETQRQVGSDVRQRDSEGKMKNHSQIIIQSTII